MDGSLDNAIPYQELEQRRAKVLAARQVPKEEEPPLETDSEAMQLIHEILNPTLKKIPKSKGAYTMPEEVKAEDVGIDGVVKELDIKKLAELKEVFSLFDTDCDGLITKEDLRFTFMMLGGESEEEVIEEMLKEAKDPLDYDAFVELMSLRTIELDPEDVLLEAWAKWDIWGTGKIDEEKMYIELTNYGDKLSKTEADEALRHAPLAKPKNLDDPPMIDYPAFCFLLSGVRKRKE